MNNKQFIIELLDKALWPIVILALVLIFRNSLTKLIPLAKKLKFKDLEIEFGAALQQASTQANTTLPYQDSRKERLIGLVDKLPNSTVLETWALLDEVAVMLVQKIQPEADLESATPYKKIEQILQQTELLDTKKVKLFSELRQLRNKVAHAKDYQVNKAEAFQYVELCIRLVTHFELLLAQQIKAVA